MALRRISVPWTQQPQEAGLALADAYADAHAVFLGSQPAAMLGAAGNLWTRNGTPLSVVGPDGIGSRASAYTTAGYWVGPSIDGATLDWPGVTIVSVIDLAYGVTSGSLASVLTCAPAGEFYGLANLTLEQGIGVNRYIYIRAGGSSNNLSLTAYKAEPSVNEWSPTDGVAVIVGRWDRSTLRLAVNRGGAVARNAAAHSFGWGTGTHLMSVGGYVRAGNRMLTTPVLLAAILPRDVGDAGEEALLATPWALFAPRRIWVPVSVGGGGSWSVSLTETASASDSLGAATTALVSLIESASAADIIGAATIAAVALTEAASASDTQTASYSATGSDSVTESASASDLLDAANTMLRALTETASADDQLAAATTMLRAISESASAGDDASASYTAAGAAAITETASATDALTAAATLLVTILEAGSATDALAAATTMVRAITEQAVAADEVTASQPIIASVSITELATAIDVLIGELAGVAWVAGDGLMSRPRIGMARNGDLYSLVLDDDGIPVACKRMGTSRLLKLRALPGGNQAQVMVETGVVLVVL